MDIYPEDRIELNPIETEALSGTKGESTYDFTDAPALFESLQKRYGELDKDPATAPFGRRLAFEIQQLKFQPIIRRMLVQLSEHAPNDIVEGFEQLLSEEED